MRRCSQQSQIFQKGKVKPALKKFYWIYNIKFIIDPLLQQGRFPRVLAINEDGRMLWKRWGDEIQNHFPMGLGVKRRTDIGCS